MLVLTNAVYPAAASFPFRSPAGFLLLCLPLAVRHCMQGSPDFREAFTWFVQQLDGYKLAYIHFIVR